MANRKHFLFPFQTTACWLVSKGQIIPMPRCSIKTVQPTFGALRKRCNTRTSCLDLISPKSPPFTSIFFFSDAMTTSGDLFFSFRSNYTSIQWKYEWMKHILPLPSCMISTYFRVCTHIAHIIIWARFQKYPAASIWCTISHAGLSSIQKQHIWSRAASRKTSL